MESHRFLRDERKFKKKRKKGIKGKRVGILYIQRDRETEKQEIFSEKGLTNQRRCAIILYANREGAEFPEWPMPVWRNWQTPGT